jgi:hypothetical protein
MSKINNADSYITEREKFYIGQDLNVFLAQTQFSSFSYVNKPTYIFVWRNISN